MIANARMYSVSPEVGGLWRSLLSLVIGRSGLPITLIEHPPPAPIADLWARRDQAAVFMCGLPFARAAPRPVLIAAPVPSMPEFESRPCYWSEYVVRADSRFRTLRDTFGERLAFTTPESQSGYGAPLAHLMHQGDRFPLFREIVAPQFTPQGAVQAVIDGAAEVAPIDSYALRLLERHRPEWCSQVRVVGRTPPTPIPVLVASAPADALQGALLEAHRIEACAPIMHELLLQRFVRPEPQTYEALRRDFEAARRYWRSHALAHASDPAFEE